MSQSVSRTAAFLTTSLVIPAGATVVSATGAGYLGTRPGASGGVVAAWQTAKLAAGEKTTGTITIAGASDGLFKGSQVTWTKPALHRTASRDRLHLGFIPAR